jgi:predicted PurR-regulated permease PerM
VITAESKLPVFVKATIFLVGLIAFFAILYIAQVIIVPLIFALIIAILLQPVVDFLVKKKVKRVLAIVITLLLTSILIMALGAFIVSQMSRFGDSWPALVEKFTLILNQTITWASGYFDIDAKKITEWIAHSKSELINSSSAAIGQTLMSVGSGLVILFLVPVYVFMILFYQPLIIDFVHKISGTGNQDKMKEIITQTKTVVQRYLLGLVIEFVIVAILNAIVLLVLDIEYAVLLAILGALLNLIPYIGGLTGVALPMMVAIATKDSAWYAIYVLVLYYIIQLIDNNFIVPKIVASKVKINALFSIIAVIAGGVLWGVPGMFLSIPLLAIVKLIFDHIEPLKPYGFLLGDTMPSLLKIKPIRIMRLKTKPK